ncbi:MAG TPA: protocatechuate 3,4-dioxygenase subunit beta, partial [Mycobacterium sp.]|nr:protocatechuate 3,4-dioxygenase subunit beta [Mycobacterium sp.]
METAAPSAAVATQGMITAEIADLAAHWARTKIPEMQPRFDYPPYRSSILRHPKAALVQVDPEEIERWSPCF